MVIIPPPWVLDSCSGLLKRCDDGSKSRLEIGQKSKRLEARKLDAEKGTEQRNLIFTQHDDKLPQCMMKIFGKVI